MKMTLEQLTTLMEAPEDEHLEFKEAKERYDFEKLVRYCAALANEHGGRMVLGVTDRRPRKVVGTRAFEDLDRTKAGLVERLHLRIEVAALSCQGKRVLVFTAPSRPLGMPIQYKGAYWMRSGEALIPMTQDQLKTIFEEADPDFSATICPAATPDDLEPEAIERFRAMWQENSRQKESTATAPAGMSVPQLLRNAELMVEEGLTYAALILLGTRKAIRRHLARAEVIFEYRSKEKSIHYQQRKEYQEGFFLFRDELWEVIDLRNDLASHTDALDGMIRRQVPTFNENAVREIILNAISHRDYRHAESSIIHQAPTKLEVITPGGLPEGITADNILWTQNRRNRLIAETFQRCGLAERAGQGVDLILETCVREGKRPPDYSRSDSHWVVTTLDGTMHDPEFVRFMERLHGESIDLGIEDFLVLDAVHRKQGIPDGLRSRLDILLEEEVLTVIADSIRLSNRFYDPKGRNGVYSNPHRTNPRPSPVEPTRQLHESQNAAEDDESFFGRRKQRDQLHDAIQQGESVQILGEQLMGKTALLRWVERHAPTWQDRPVVRIDAEGVAGHSPEELLVAVAKSRGIEGKAKEKLRSESGLRTEVLEVLLPLVLLIDNGSALGRNFDAEFLDLLRSKTQERTLVIVLTARENLRHSLQSQRLSSRFLNDAQIVWTEQLEPEAARALAARHGQTAVERILEQAGRIPYALKMLTDLMQQSESDDWGAVCDRFAVRMESLFSDWWQSRSDEEQSLLRKCVAGVMRSTLATTRDRYDVSHLEGLGLLVEQNGLYKLPGAAWREYVQDVPPGRLTTSRSVSS
jgi:ATP-dependent DNA helicase RecG